MKTEINITTIDNSKIEILLSNDDEKNSKIIVDKKAHDKLLKLEIYEIFNKIKENANKENIEFLFNIKVSEKDIETVKKASELRRLINNDIKGVTNVPCFQRNNEDKIDFQSMLTELMLSKYLWSKYKSISRDIKENFQIRTPEIANVFLNHKEEDYKLSVFGSNVEFDLKSQFINCRYQTININQKSHKRFIDNKTDLYIVGLIECNDDNLNNYENVTSINYISIPIKYFDKNKIEVNDSFTNRFTPYYKLKLKDFKNLIKERL